MRRLLTVRFVRFFFPVVLLFGIAAAIYLIGVNFAGDSPDRREPVVDTNKPNNPPSALARTHEAQTGSRYLASPANPFRAPIVRELTLPAFADATSVWGATGRDDNGGIWVGVSASHQQMSAHLMHYNPNTNRWQDRGNVADQLRTAGLIGGTAGQVKIHTRIVPADDGWLYFGSMDNVGENQTASGLPRPRGHLWRIDPRTYQWQHVAAIGEDLIATASAGRYVFALGATNHVLYRYDTASSTTKRVVVGSIAGHVSRNLFADARGHVYVPRAFARGDGKAFADLVEYDDNLVAVAATPLDYYFGNEAPVTNHGIVALAYLADERIVFTTHRGQLYTVSPRQGKPASVTASGWFHPAGEAYVPSLFSYTGKSLLAGITFRGERYEWVVYDLESRFSSVFMLHTGNLQNGRFYGSVSRDNGGRFYVGGTAATALGKSRPVVLQITTP